MPAGVYSRLTTSRKMWPTAIPDLTGKVSIAALSTALKYGHHAASPATLDEMSIARRIGNYDESGVGRLVTQKLRSIGASACQRSKLIAIHVCLTPARLSLRILTSTCSIYFYHATLCISAVFELDRQIDVRCPSGCLSRSCIQTARDIVKLLSPPSSPIILVFWPRAQVPNFKGETSRISQKGCVLGTKLL